MLYYIARSYDELILLSKLSFCADIAAEETNLSKSLALSANGPVDVKKIRRDIRIIGS